MSSPIEKIEGYEPELIEFIEHTRRTSGPEPEAPSIEEPIDIPEPEPEPVTPVEEPTRTPKELVELIENKIKNIRNQYYVATHLDIGINRDDRLLQYAEYQIRKRMDELKETIETGTTVFDTAEIGTLHVKNLIMPTEGLSLPTMSRFFPGMPSLPNLGQPSHNFKIH